MVRRIQIQILITLFIKKIEILSALSFFFVYMIFEVLSRLGESEHSCGAFDYSEK